MFETFKKKIIKKTGLALERTIPQPNAVDNTLEEVINYKEQAEIINNETNKEDSIDNAA